MSACGAWLVREEEYMPEIHAGDLLIVGTLIVLEGLLSADNALVLALLVRHLPQTQQKRALLYGLVGAFLLRGMGIFFAQTLINLWWVCAIGSTYLIGLSIRHFILLNRHGKEEDDKPQSNNLGFWQTVVMVELTDLLFAIDSILVAVALVSDPSRIWIVYTGGFLGIVLLRLAATFFIRLIERYPTLDSLAYMLVSWAGVKLASSSVDIYYRSRGVKHDELPHLLPTPVFWGIFALIIIGGAWYTFRHKRSDNDLSLQETSDRKNENTLNRLKSGEFTAISEDDTTRTP
jgi:YkoY family integral membrane protein